jgi:hypothetical protein
MPAVRVGIGITIERVGEFKAEDLNVIAGNADDIAVASGRGRGGEAGTGCRISRVDNWQSPIRSGDT